MRPLARAYKTTSINATRIKGVLNATNNANHSSHDNRMRRMLAA
jgi:hypothetical protein